MATQQGSQNVRLQDIGWAVKQMHTGSRVRRAGWNGKGMWLALVAEGAAMIPQKISDGYDVMAFVAMKTADNKFVPWLCSQTDLLAIDWEIAE